MCQAEPTAGFHHPEGVGAGAGGAVVGALGAGAGGDGGGVVVVGAGTVVVGDKEEEARARLVVDVAGVDDAVDGSEPRSRAGRSGRTHPPATTSPTTATPTSSRGERLPSRFDTFPQILIAEVLSRSDLDMRAKRSRNASVQTLIASFTHDQLVQLHLVIVQAGAGSPATLARGDPGDPSDWQDSSTAWSRPTSQL
jgi:hypothetical protein